MPYRIASLVLVAACGGAGPGDDAGDDTEGDDGVDPSSCMPDEVFCNGALIRRCTTSGTDSVVLRDCATELDLPFDVACVDCGGGGHGCGREPAAIEGTIRVGNWTRSYVYPDGCTNTYLRADAGVNGYGGFTQQVWFPLPFFMFRTTAWAPYDGPLYDSDRSEAPVELSIESAPMTGASWCYSADATSTPPSYGHARLELGDRTIGSPFSISVEGYVVCRVSGVPTWHQVELTAHGMITAE